MPKMKGDDIMAGGYDGSIRIDTRINTLPIDNGIEKIENKLKSLGSAIGIAFGAKELVSFGQSAINAASDLTEAQNVVDTAFGEMSYKMEQFASTALETYGISELTAKTMGSTYMAMAKGMGVATDAASDMAVTLTGRLSDIMSFYNKTQSEVDTIGRAVITGETEPLKAIGVVMTQTNLEAYAMAQGLSKTYSEMSANEQLLVRYKYFLEQTSLAQGDFAKTSDSWANQTRLLSERLDQFMTNLGNVLINTFTPALQFANEAVSFLNELFFGGNEEDTTAAKNAVKVTDEVAAVGTAAEKSQKKLNALLSSFDELHIISGSGSDDEDSGAVGIDTSNLLGVNLEADTSTAKSAAKKYREILEEIYLTVKNHPFTQAITGVFDTIGKIIGGYSEKKYNVSSFVDALLNILSAIIAFKAVSSAVKIITSSFKAIKTAFTTLKDVCSNVGLFLGVGTGGFALAIGIAAGFALMMSAILEFSKTMMNQKIEEKFGDIRLSFEQVEELCSPISEGYEKMAQKFQKHRDTIDNLKSDFSDLNTELGETLDNYTKMGNVDAADVPKLKQTLESTIDSLDELLSEQTFGSANMLENFFSLDGIDDDEQNVLDEITSFGNSLDGKIETIRSQIQSITQRAIDENRNLLESEIQNIRDLYDEIEKYGNIKNTAVANAAWDLLDTDISGNIQIDKTSYEMLLERVSEAEQNALTSISSQREEMYKEINEMAELMRIDGSSVAEINKFKEESYEAINKTYDDERADAVIKANKLRSKIASGLAASIMNEDGITITNQEYTNPFDFLFNYGDIDVSNMVIRITSEIENAQDQILSAAFDKSRVQSRFDSAYSNLDRDALNESFSAAGQEAGISFSNGFNEGTSSSKFDYVPVSETFLSEGNKSGRAWSEGFYSGTSDENSFKYIPTSEIFTQEGLASGKAWKDGFVSGVSDISIQSPTITNIPNTSSSSTLDINLFINNEKVDSEVITPDWRKPVTYNKNIITNGKGE